LTDRPALGRENPEYFPIKTGFFWEYSGIGGLLKIKENTGFLA
jgi:hypothetical protein